MRENLREELIQSVIYGEEFNKIVETASKYLNNPLVIINNSYNIIAYSNCIQVDDLTWNNAVKRGYITLEFAATLNNWDDIKDENRKYECLTVNKINKLCRRFYKLIINSQLMGYMNVTQINGNFDDIDEECYHFVSQIFAKEIFISQKFITQNRHTKKEEILLELTNNSYVNRIHFTERVQSSNLNIKSKYRVACSDLSNFLSYNADEDNLKDKLLSFFSSGTIIIVRKVLIILIDIEHSSYIDFYTDKKLDKYLKSQKLTLGISDVFHDLYEFERYKAQAIKSYKLKEFLLYNNSNHIFYEQVKIYDLLHQIPKDNLIYFCNQKIYEIYEYDKVNQTNYLNTLHIYLETNRSIKMTSNYLYLHRNTINYRILKIKELFELCFDDDTMLHQFLFSCYIIHILV